MYFSGSIFSPIGTLKGKTDVKNQFRTTQIRSKAKQNSILNTLTKIGIYCKDSIRFYLDDFTSSFTYLFTKHQIQTF